MVVLLVLLMFALPYALSWFRKHLERPSATTAADGWGLVNQSPGYWIDSGASTLVANSTSACLEPPTYE
jgi:hypothetical protein